MIGVILRTINTVITTFMVLHKNNFWLIVSLMSVFSFFLTLFFLLIYDYKKADWLGIEKDKEIIKRAKKLHSDNKETRKFTVFVKTALRQIKIFLLGPRVVILYYRKGINTHDGIPNIFTLFLVLISSFLSNIIWVTIIKTILIIVK